ncbi:type II toxin-antitoxin system RelB/DinJ family antitoxin [Candidatus Gracilibacteria bacterium]|nr:type II toxin-antitoxin system RelB/DinJ family antitoxin [Candidatus Gracilibacteria bacterium]MCF7819442.1 type II toxin-antitoxin system RelB/DinJ family antitoxin [Candidatus Gracilibacteria bacterium]
MAHIQIRISEQEKEQVKQVLDQMGLSYSGAIKLFFRKMIQEQKLPFSISAVSGVSSPKPTSSSNQWNTFTKRKIGS